LLVVGLGLPALVVWHRHPIETSDLLLYAAAFLFVLLATLVGGLLASRMFFPSYWWMGQVEGKDVFEFEGVYFLGLRLSRIPNRLQRIVFGVDDQMRTWDLVFGLIFLVLLVPHTMAFITGNMAWDRYLPNPVQFTQSLHQPVLSALPVMREWNTEWRADARQAKRIDEAIAEIQGQGLPGAAQRFRLAQLYLLKAFRPRERPGDPFYHSPGESVFFNRGTGARAVEHLQVLLALPELQRVGWSGGALALIGLFHLSDRNFAEAADFLERALREMGERDETGLSRYLVLLMGAQGEMLNGRSKRAIELLEQILVNERLPAQAYALAMEHYAEALRLQGDGDRAPELLNKALQLYERGKDRSGQARIHLRLAALALDNGQRKKASEEMSIAASLAYGMEDGFALNMVETLSLAFSG
jgi:tetratricopeptide (TPR) repeat protein